jgi:hypothetical protein
MAYCPGVAFAVVLSAAAGGAAEAPDVVVETEAMALHLRAAPAFYLSALVHRASGVNLISGAGPTPLFTLYLGPEGAGGREVSSLEARRSTVQVESVGADRRVTLTYGEFPLPGLTVIATAAVPAEGPLTSWTLRLHFDGPTALRAVRFPQLAAVPAIEDAADDVFVLPSLPGALIRHPAQAWGPTQAVWLKYPGDLSAQFVAYQDKKAGLYLASQDATARPRRLGIWRRPDGFRLAHEFTLGADPVTDWESPYPCTVGVTQGTWCDTADLYKAWASRQTWCQRQVHERDDIPAWWKAGPLVHVCCVREYDAKGVQTGSFYPKLGGHVEALRRQVDGDLVLMLAGWEQHRRWSGGDYFPIYDETTARPVISALRNRGVRPFLFLSGLFWTFDNEGVNGNCPPVPDALLPAFVRDPKTGKPQEFTLGESTPERVWERHSYQFCVTPAATRTFLREVVDRAHALGIDLLQMDQTTTGGGAACAAPDHGHPVGAGAYQTQAFIELLADLRAYGKTTSPDFVLLHEEPHEELIPVLDGFHVREYKERWWYRGAPGAVGIPLFSYLYHEYAIGYGGDSATLSTKPDPWCVRMHAVNLVTGLTPGLSVWVNPAILASADPAPLAMLRAHSRLLQRGGGPFLMLGRMLHPLPLAVPEMIYQVGVKGKDGWHREPFVEPAILTSSWEAPDGRIAHVFVNPTPEPRALVVDLDTRNLPAWPSADVQLYSSAAGEAFQPLASAAKLPFRLTRDLAPREVLCVVLGR